MKHEKNRFFLISFKSNDKRTLNMLYKYFYLLLKSIYSMILTQGLTQ